MLSLITKTSLETQDGQDFISINEDEIEGHPSIMKLYDAIDYQRHLYLVTECCKGKMLSTIIRDYKSMGSAKRNLPEDICKKIFYQISLGM